MKSELIKPAFSHSEYTQDQIFELQKCAADPIYFIQTYVKIMHPTRGAIPFVLYPYQIRAIKAFKENKWVIMKQPRQTGKTQIIAGFLLWFGSFNFDKNILVASKDNKAAMDIMNRIKYSYEELPNWIKPGCIYFNRHEIAFDNNSTIQCTATTENTGRGQSLSFLLIDELAFVKKSIQAAMWTSLAPTLSTGGSCVIASTPNGDQELYCEIWNGANTFNGEKPGQNGFFPLSIEWNEHPDRDETYKNEMIKKIGEEKWRQEYCCEFVSSEPLLISPLKLVSLIAKEPIAHDLGFKWYKPIKAGCRYLIGVDVAEGNLNDFSTIVIFETVSLDLVATFRDNSTDESRLYELLKKVIKKILSVKLPDGSTPEIMWSYESNAQGRVITALYYKDDSFPEEAELISGSAKLGFQTTAASKSEACSLLKRLIENPNGMKIHSSELITELKTFVKTGSSYEAQTGGTDDLISACLVVTRIIKKTSEFDEDSFNQLYRSNVNKTEANLEQDNVEYDIEPMGFLTNYS